MKKNGKALIYVIDRSNEKRSAHEIKRDMKRCDICILLGNKKTPQMEIEEKLANHLKMAIFYRPAVKSFERLLQVGAFPNHQKRR